MNKKQTSKRSTRPLLKSIKLAVCLEGDWIIQEFSDPRFTRERDEFLESHFEARLQDLDSLSWNEVGANVDEIAQAYDVILTHLPPSGDSQYRMLCQELRAEEVISAETFWFSEYCQTLTVVRQLAHAGLPVIGYTKASDEAMKIFAKTGFFHSLHKKTHYFRKDCQAIEKEILKACRHRSR